MKEEDKKEGGRRRLHGKDEKTRAAKKFEESARRKLL